MFSKNTSSLFEKINEIIDEKCSEIELLTKFLLIIKEAAEQGISSTENGMREMVGIIIYASKQMFTRLSISGSDVAELP